MRGIVSVVGAVAGTAVGLAALLSFKTMMENSTPTTAASSPATSPAGAKQPAAVKTATVADVGRGRRVATGKVIETGYGPVQVQVALRGKRLTKVTVLQHTDDGLNSQHIDGFALPQLTREALRAQSAKIHAVSGATYTSQGYIQSLQSALDVANM